MQGHHQFAVTGTNASTGQMEVKGPKRHSNATKAAILMKIVLIGWLVVSCCVSIDAGIWIFMDKWWFHVFEELSHSDTLVLNKNSCPIHQGLFWCPMANQQLNGTTAAHLVVMACRTARKKTTCWDEMMGKLLDRWREIYPLVICDIAIENGDL